jgi:hypothetical protein
MLEREPRVPKEAPLPIKVLQNFYHQNDELTEVTIKEFSEDLIRYIYKHSGDESQ